MNIIPILRNFVSAEEGAVIVDWVVLTAGIVGIGIVVVTSVAVGAVDLGDDTTTAIEATTIVTHEG